MCIRDSASRINRHLDIFVDEHNLGETTVESGYLLSRNPDVVVGPDAAFISTERLARQGDDPYPPAPELAVEIVSPNDRAGEIATKVQKYLTAGTNVVWVVYPDEKLVYVHQPGGKAQIIDIHGTLDGGDILTGFTLPLNEVFKGL